MDDFYVALRAKMPQGFIATAKACGMSSSTFNRFIQGNHKCAVRLDNFMTVMRHLKCTPEEIMNFLFLYERRLNPLPPPTKKYHKLLECDILGVNASPLVHGAHDA